MLSLATIAFNNLPSSEVEIVSSHRRISNLNMLKFEKVAQTLEFKHNEKCSNCEPLERYGIVCRNCLIFGHSTMRPESNMMQVYIDYDLVEQTEMNIMRQEIMEYRQTLENIYTERE